ncbi:hypothetical protein SAMN02745166_02742 [Prosthecobacter debontii]|uniref:Uncharacterized protein n=1 Tax=Prosthecobacter debontii TaxID=48467 RepID=A0A1T4Y9E6_9BACT|nr:hypothetical protein [Prosthecobacter debontii]SKA98376.1 hypothetical protein SAMN02745166_02742 [Prosthecobacter debontii]
MKNRSLPGRKTPRLWQVLILCGLALPAVAQQGYSYPPPPGYGQSPAYPQQGYGQRGYPQQGYSQPQYSQPRTEYVSPMEFLPTFGRKFGDMFRRMFYGDSAPQGYSSQPQSQHGGYPQGRSLDNAPPSYQSHYGQYPQQGYATQPSYPSQQPRYQQPTAQGQMPPQQPQYQTPPQQRLPTNPPTQQGSRMNSSPPPRVSVKPKAPQSSPPAKYTPPTITKKSSPAVQDTPPSPPKKEVKQSKSSSSSEYYPLPGAQPKKEEAPPSSTASSSKPKTNSSSTAGNSGSFLKGKRAGKEGRVISPYPPYQELDVTGLSSGSLALDPTTQKVFEVP